MGCGSSESVSVINVRPNGMQNEIKPTIATTPSSSSKALPSLVFATSATDRYNSNNKEITPPVLLTKPKFNSLIPLTPLVKFQMSATDSGVSSKNNDDDDYDNESLDFDADVKTETSASSDSSEFEYDDKEYKNIITENSRPDVKERVEKSFMDRNGLGKSCPTLLSTKEKEAIHQKEEKLSLDMLRNNGLIQKPLVVKQNYAHFEIVEQQPKQVDSLFSRNHSVKSRAMSSSDNGSLSPDNNLKKLPPARLLKLEKNAKPAMTSDQIEEKILKANQRKKELNKLKTKNSFSVDKKQNGMEKSGSFGRQSAKFDQEFDQEVLERQAKLREIRDKLKAKDSEISTPRTPRSNELVTELEKFRPKTAKNFRPDFS